MPNAPVLNKSHPLARGLVFATVGGSAIDLVTGRRGTIAGNLKSNGRTRYGPGLESFTAAGTDYITFDRTYAASRITNAFTVVAFADLDSITAWGKIFCIPSTDGAWSGFAAIAIGQNGAGATDQAQLTYHDGANEVNFIVGNYFAAGSRVYGYTRVADQDAAYVDGVQINSRTTAITANVGFTRSGTPNTICILTRSNYSAGEGQDGREAFVGLWNRALSKADMAVLGKSFAPLLLPRVGDPQMLILVTTAAGGASTATPAAVATVAAVPAPTLQATSVATPGVVVTTTLVPAPTIRIDQTVTVAAVATVAAVPAPTLLASSVATPAAVVTVAAVPAPTLKADTTVTPGVVPTIVAVPAPTPLVSGNSTATPSAVATVAAVPTPTPTSTSQANPAAVVTVAAVPSPTLSSSRTATPAAVVTVVAVPSPTLLTASAVSPTQVVTIAGIPAPSIIAASKVLVAVVPTVTTIPTPGISTNPPAPNLEQPLTVDTQSTILDDNPADTVWDDNPADTEFKADPLDNDWESDL